MARGKRNSRTISDALILLERIGRGRGLSPLGTQLFHRDGTEFSGRRIGIGDARRPTPHTIAGCRLRHWRRIAGHFAFPEVLWNLAVHLVRVGRVLPPRGSLSLSCNGIFDASVAGGKEFPARSPASGLPRKLRVSAHNFGSHASPGGGPCSAENECLLAAPRHLLRLLPRRLPGISDFPHNWPISEIISYCGPVAHRLSSACLRKPVRPSSCPPA
jgi:hypothetical protein